MHPRDARGRTPAFAFKKRGHGVGELFGGRHDSQEPSGVAERAFSYYGQTLWPAHHARDARLVCHQEREKEINLTWLARCQAVGCHDCLAQNQRRRPPEHVQVREKKKGRVERRENERRREKENKVKKEEKGDERRKKKEEGRKIGRRGKRERR